MPLLSTKRSRDVSTRIPITSLTYSLERGSADAPLYGSSVALSWPDRASREQLLRPDPIPEVDHKLIYAPEIAALKLALSHAKPRSSPRRGA